MKEQDILMYQDLRLERSNRKLQANGKENPVDSEGNGTFVHFAQITGNSF